MEKRKREYILKNMQVLSELVDSRLDENNESREKITYCENIEFGRSGLAERNVYIVEILNENKRNIGDKSETDPNREEDVDGLEKYTTYEIYDKENNLIATVDQEGKIHFNERYLQTLRDIDKNYFDSLNLEDINFEIPEELKENDLVMTKEELKEHRQRENQEGARTYKEKDGKEEEKEEEQEENDKQDLDKKQEEQIAESKGIPRKNILKIRENSNFYKDHPELEPNLYFYKDADGIIKAEYIDENGKPQPSKYFEESQTALRQETVALGDDGNPVVKEVPHQVMQTKNLSGTDKDIRDIRINVKIDTYGYLEISEARQGMNGMWASHDIEVRGRDYNSYNINKATSIETRKANPDKQTEAYEKTEDTGLVQEGIQYDEMYLMEHADEIIQEFIEEGYNKNEAIQIFDLMIGEEALTEEQAKSRVNEQIKDREENEKEEQEKEVDEENEGRTPWGDAEERRRR